MSRKSMETWHSLTFYYEAMESLERGNLQDAELWLAKGIAAYPDNSWAVLAQAGILNHQHQWAEARELYLRALNQPESTPEFQAHLWNAIAWMDLMIATPPLLGEADQFSRQALEEIPWSSYAKGTRGSVLIELGEIEEGVPLVEQALREHDKPSDKALNACYLAIAMIGREDTVNRPSTLRKRKSLIQIARCLSGRQRNWNNGEELDSMKFACRSCCQPRAAAAENCPRPPSRLESCADSLWRIVLKAI